MTTSAEDLEAAIKIILPEEYQETYEDVQPVSMGSAGLKFDSTGKVAWDEIWGSFCDLAMAGGPPHKGALLEPGSLSEIAAQPQRYREVVDEICRGILMVTEIDAEPSSTPGWIRIDCVSHGMAGWLVRAIVMENVSAHCEGSVIELPAGPAYRLEKEIKNVITVIAKTCHYWLGHMWPAQHREIANLFVRMSEKSPLVQPRPSGDTSEDEPIRRKMSDAIEQATGLKTSDRRYTGWLGVECLSVRSAIWMMRAMVVGNVLSRREGTILFLPINPEIDPNGEIAVQSLIRVHGLAVARNVL